MKSEMLKEGISKAEEAWESDRLMYPGCMEQGPSVVELH